MPCSLRSSRCGPEKVTGKVRLIIDFGSVDIGSVGEVVAAILGTAADSSEGGETGSRSGVSVDVDHFAALDVLEKSHRRVACVVLSHSGVVLALADVKTGVLEDASLAVCAFGRVVQEVLANRGQVLAAQTLLLLELVLAVGKSTALFLLAVFAVLAVEPEATEFGLDLLLPAIFQLDVFGEGGEYIVHSHRRGLAGELLSDQGRL